MTSPQGTVPSRGTASPRLDAVFPHNHPSTGHNGANVTARDGVRTLFVVVMSQFCLAGTGSSDLDTGEDA